MQKKEVIPPQYKHRVLHVVAVAYKRSGELKVFVQSWINQSANNWLLTVIHDGPDNEFDEIMARYKSEAPAQIDYFCTEKRYNDFGHTLRELGILRARGDYLLLTNADNYFVPKTLEYLNEEITKKESDLILFDMIHSHNKPGNRDLPSYSFFETSLARNSIDISSAIVKNDLARMVGFRDKTFAGDATYFEDILKLKPTLGVSKVQRCLFVHN